ncbi:hypothetical protein [Streptosporangium roseum]|uniref:hypothetical protein n=1 Tax=Streptosporangium roseum TaxID=2001 RepID=UPI003324F16A
MMDFAAILDLNSPTATGSSTNPDGSPSAEFLVWEAKLAVRATVWDLLAAGRRLHISIGVPVDHATTATVMGVAMVKAATSPDVKRVFDAYHEAYGAFVNAMVALAEVDVTVDIGPLLGR